ncbi:MAG TPA: adenylyltransferase/cytidyltransferase family protein [Acidimicrobiales bacterium]|nr:adenylyltransferase/cytidyltransferase family protein [Acidimicrobiales bacterium]
MSFAAPEPAAGSSGADLDATDGSEPAAEYRAPLSLRWYGGPPPTPTVAPVVVTGVFDVLHPGHVRFLTWAAAKARPVYVGVEDDARVRHWKGPGRPVHTLAERAEVLAALRPVTKVFYILGDPAECGFADYVELLRPIGPGALAITTGDPYAEAKRVGATALGAELWRFPFEVGHSTSALLGRLGWSPPRPDRRE